MIGNLALGFAACWSLATLLMWRRLAIVSGESPGFRLFLALAWPAILWSEGR